MLANLRHVSDGGFPVVLVSVLSCLVLLYWREMLFLLCVLLMTVLVYGFFALGVQPG